MSFKRIAYSLWLALLSTSSHNGFNLAATILNCAFFVANCLSSSSKEFAGSPLEDDANVAAVDCLDNDGVVAGDADVGVVLVEGVDGGKAASLGPEEANSFAFCFSYSALDADAATVVILAGADCVMDSCLRKATT